MAEWFQVFDDERVLVQARSKARRRVVGFALASGALVAIAPLATVVWPVHAGPLAVGCGLLLTAYAVWMLIGLHSLHRLLWRLELSVRRAVGHDVGGRRVSLPWSDLTHLDVRDDGLILTGRDVTGRRARLHVSAAMPQFADLSHRAAEYAEAFGRPILVDGHPVEALPIASLYPSTRAGSAPAV